MIPDSCVATIDTLPATGAGTGVLWLVVIAAAVVLAAGAAALVAARGRSRHAAGGVLALALLFGAAAAIAPASPAAAVGSVDYGAGCTLLRVDDVVVPSTNETSLVPGSEVVVLSATVRNPTGSPVRIALAAELDAASALTATPHVDGVPAAELRLAPGGAATVSVRVGLPLEADDSAQGLRTSTRLVLTAEQR